jgi:hypothetical protein
LPCAEDDQESPGVDDLEAPVAMARSRGRARDASSAWVKWGREVEWKESRTGGARCEVGDAETAGRREVKSPPTRGRGETELYGQQGGDTEVEDGGRESVTVN